MSIPLRKPVALGSRANPSGKLIGSLAGVTAELVDLARGGLDQEERAISEGLAASPHQSHADGQSKWNTHQASRPGGCVESHSAAGGWRGRALLPQLSSLGPGFH